MWRNCKSHYISLSGDLGDEENVLRKSLNWEMGPNFDVSARPTFITEFSKQSESLNIEVVAT